MNRSADDPGAREAILGAIAKVRPAPVALPDVEALARPSPLAPDDLVRQFVAAARAGGAEVVETSRVELARLASRNGARAVLSRVAEVPSTVAADEDPRRLARLDRFVCEASLGVAENGAVWLGASALGERAALFLATDVLVVLDRARIVADLHAAYAQLDLPAEPFGAFVAGPSKTADIEQALVVGAHGPKGLCVALVTARADR